MGDAPHASAPERGDDPPTTSAPERGDDPPHPPQPALVCRCCRVFRSVLQPLPGTPLPPAAAAGYSALAGRCCGEAEACGLLYRTSPAR
ncbi:hypothetical protein GCM10027440_47700 [Nocardiopsis coralliicola]